MFKGQLSGKAKAASHMESRRQWFADLSTSQRTVRYNCGNCGYALNLCSSDRELKNKRHVNVQRSKMLVFTVIDESGFHFEDDEELHQRWDCNLAKLWSICLRRNRIMCSNCNSRIGYTLKSYRTSKSDGLRCYLDISRLQPV